jgi:hypothetical protein
LGDNGILPPSHLKVDEERVVSLGHLLAVGLPSPIVFGIDVETLGVAGISNRREDGSLDTAIQQIIPVGFVEEGMFPDARGTTANVAETAGTIDSAEGADQVLGFVGDWGVLGEHDGFFQDSRRVSFEFYGRGMDKGKAYCL